jgi:hypothetical protein
MRFMFLFSMLIAIGCGKGSTKRLEDLKKEWIQTIKVGDVWLTTRVLPKVNNTASENHLIYFNVKIEKVTESLPEKEKLLYLNFDMQKDFTLLIGHDSISSVFCQRIENGIRGSYEYVVAFEEGSKNLSDTYSLIYNDQIFGIGTVEFLYHSKELKKLRA